MAYAETCGERRLCGEVGVSEAEGGVCLLDGDGRGGVCLLGEERGGECLFFFLERFFGRWMSGEERTESTAR